MREYPRLEDPAFDDPMKRPCKCTRCEKVFELRKMFRITRKAAICMDCAFEITGEWIKKWFGTDL